MAAGFADRTADWLLRRFPERQIYLRSNGHVQFVVLSPGFQLLGTVVLFTVICWVAYASVMTSFKDEILTSAQDRLQSTREKYEAQIARMRLDYDDLSGKMANAERRISGTIAEIESRQAELQAAMNVQSGTTGVIDEVTRRAATVRALGLGPGAVPIESDDTTAVGGTADRPPPPRPAPAEPEKPKEPEPAAGGGTPAAPEAPGPVSEALDHVPPVAKPFGTRNVELAEAPPPPAPLPASMAAVSAPAAPAVPPELSGRHHAVAIALASFDSRLEFVKADQKSVALHIAETATAQEENLRELLLIVGLEPGGIAPLPDAQGGPLVYGPTDDPLSIAPALAETSASLDRAEALQRALLAAPIANPIPDVTRISSGFGGRRDPFTGGSAFHAGLDFKAAYGAPIYAVAPGVVVHADWQGGFGKLVEIDHGFGFKTRYAHLSAINVAVGQRLAFGEQVGALGNTGRSTGPHLHYEIWFDGQARNPLNYLKAGAHVLERQGS